MSAPRRIVLLAGGPSAPAVGAALAEGLRAGARTAVAVLLLPPGPEAVRLPPSAGARRLAASLQARGIVARTSGRLVLVTWEPGAAAGDVLGRVEAAAGDAPVVVVVSGPRTDAGDATLREADAVVAAMPSGADPALRVLLAVGGAPVTTVLTVDVPVLGRSVPFLAGSALREVRAAGRALGAGR